MGLINVNFVGEVNYPGQYPLHPFSNLISGLIQANGINIKGSLRDVKILRDGKELMSVDFYEYFSKGIISKEIQLKDKDIVFVPFRKSHIKIDSLVKRPGIYEFKRNETLADLLIYAGGLEFNASKKLTIRRTKPIDERNDGDLLNESIYIDYRNSDKMKLFDGDHVIVREAAKNLSFVTSIGVLKKPGKYDFFEGMLLKDLINLSGGLSDTTFLKSIYFENAEIVRREPNKSYESIINIDVDQVLNNGPASMIELMPLDKFIVRANKNFFERENIIINGEVKIPGSYSLLFKNETLGSAIQRAGGLTEKALDRGISIFRLGEYYFDSNLNETKDKVPIGWQNYSFQLMPGDSIVVKRSTRTVNIVGEVHNPRAVEYKKGKNIKYYINSVGGFNQLADKKNIYVISANGIVVPVSRFNSPNIYDGSTIVISAKSNEDKIDITQFATNWTSILSSLITVFVLTKQL